MNNLLMEQRYVWRNDCKAFNPKNTAPGFKKHSGGGSWIMLRACSAASGTALLHSDSMKNSSLKPEIFT